MAATTQPHPITGFVRLPQVLKLIPVSRSTWWEWCRTGKAPKPVKLGERVTAWRAADINALIEHLGADGKEAA
ncbi:MAG: AlpA family phage regulatory protein [Rhodocyclaceae bacterium]|nr:AlpA family phage regulatory protein [Rhodocyclaceae bacterium]